MNDKPTHIDLFSGIGGFSLAAQWAGFETVCFCEKDEFCQKVLAERFGAVADSEYLRKLQSEGGKQNIGRWSSDGNIPIIPDIRDFDGTEWRGATLLTGGFPCQPFSVAGQRRGKEDDRYLWPELFKAITDAKPTWLIIENVIGIVKLAVGQMLTDLESIGYDFPRDLAGNPIIPVIPACAKNAPHRRDRVWIIAHASNAIGRGCGTERECGSMEAIHRGGQDNPVSLTESDSDAPDSGFQGLSGITCEQFSGISSEVETSPRSKPSGADAAREQWQIPWIEIASRLCTLDDGLSPELAGRPLRNKNRVQRLKAAGNAIVPQIAYEIIKYIYRIESGGKG